ncbi:radical SAM protein, partial [Aminipila sp.]|uniref:radical SAM protein n=1 Tax=Aminipila sp. TaxID=2060095 RepID=UPI00289D3DCB
MKKGYLYLDPTPKMAEYRVPQYSPYYFIYTPETLDKPQQKFVLNDTAFEIVKQFDGTKTYDKILAMLSDKYVEPIHIIEDKIKPFISQLESMYHYSLQEQSQPVQHKITIDSFSNIYPTAASIELTDRCNMKCKHCYGNFEPENLIDMPLEQAFFILQSLKDIGIHVVEITGGDPSVYPNIDLVVTKANEIGIPSIMFLTNGLYLPENLLNALSNVKQKGFVQVDLHSLNEEYFDWFTGTKGGLHKVKSNIDRLIANGIRVRVAAIFTPGNVHEIVDLADWAHEHGALLYAPSVVTAMGRASKEALHE